MSVYVITPWYGDTYHLIEAYAKAVAGATVVAVDNATPEATAEALSTTPWRVLRLVENAGFAGGNNIGYNAIFDEAQPSDVIVFLNSDVALPEQGDFVASVAHDVKHGALYGPSLQAQLVAGRFVPYLEGWCVAATVQTWEHIAYADQLGPWDAKGYPGPYWEDNDLCLRALNAGVSLIQTNWPIVHLGGRSTGSITKWAHSLEQNRATFAKLAMEILPAPREKIGPAEAAFRANVQQQTDIRHHLPLLRSLGQGLVVECGVRSGQSTSALLAGVEQQGGMLVSIDTADSSHLFRDHPRWSFLQGDSTNPETIAVLRSELPQPITTLLLDTLHTYEHVAAELELWHPEVAPGGHIVVHDTESFPGVRRAVEEFCTRKGWPVTIVLPDNGLAVIEVPS
jgi:GT2 family glycosyltransferase